MLQARVPALCRPAQPSSAPAAASAGPACAETGALRPAPLLPLPRERSPRASLAQLLSGSKEDAKYIQANIKNSLSHDKGGKKVLNAQAC